MVICFQVRNSEDTQYGQAVIGQIANRAIVENTKPAPIPTKKTYAGEFVKNRKRDTAWFAMIDKNWSDIKFNMEKWLYVAESDLSLAVLNKRLLSSTCVDKDWNSGFT